MKSLSGIVVLLFKLIEAVVGVEPLIFSSQKSLLYFHREGTLRQRNMPFTNGVWRITQNDTGSIEKRS